ncbi:hypothetical protein HHK36_012997 [Tetracentron sinense]|uniref:S-protein homolog n=1 Tax=Tetracentron sinense TaxID=13715 RepID=A0A834Z9Y1_TETSI|nr:hypothetical protein HHK36_012997 [Tetracentron sinense]
MVTSNSCLLILVLALVLCESTIVQGKYRVSITNGMGEGTMLGLHCLSGDDDLGPQFLPSNITFSWSFNLNFWGTTLFYCNMAHDNLHGHYNVFEWKRDYHRCGDVHQCLWLQEKDGLYFFNYKVQQYQLEYKWP